MLTIHRSSVLSSRIASVGNLFPARSEGGLKANCLQSSPKQVLTVQVRVRVLSNVRTEEDEREQNAGGVIRKIKPAAAALRGTYAKTCRCLRPPFEQVE